jgi:pimeloyl-ACP methyl ester carboxylesterase
MQKTLIIIPGWGGSKETWADFVVLAKEKFGRVEVIELPCFGEVPCPTEVWGVEEYSAYAKDEISKIQNHTPGHTLLANANSPKVQDSEFALLGHSFGGVVAANIVANNPDIVNKLVLSGAPLYRPKYYPKRILVGAVSKVLKVVLLPFPSIIRNKVRKVCYRIIGSPDYAKTAGIKQDIFKKVIREDTSANIAKLTLPTLVVWGSKDAYVPLKFGKKIADSLPNGELVVIEGGPHGLHLRRKEELLNIISL